MKGKIILILGAALNYAPTVFAQTTGPYIGVGVAQATTYIEDMTYQTLEYNYLFTGNPIFFTSSHDNTATKSTWTLYGGYQLNRYIAIEALYQPLGEYTREGSNHGLTDPGKTVDAGIGAFTSLQVKEVDTLKLDGYGLSALATIPVANYLFIIGKVGAFYWDGSLDRASSLGPVNGKNAKTLVSTDHSTGYSPMYGIGLRIDVKRGLSVRADWSHINSIGSGLSTGESHANVSSLSAQFNF